MLLTCKSGFIKTKRLDQMNHDQLTKHNAFVHHIMPMYDAAQYKSNINEVCLANVSLSNSRTSLNLRIH